MIFDSKNNKKLHNLTVFLPNFTALIPYNTTINTTLHTERSEVSTMKEVTRVVIKGESGYVGVDDAYKDKVTITPESISYEYMPLFALPDNANQKWSYKTINQAFKERFVAIAEELIKELDRAKDERWLDVGALEIVITFADRTQRKERYFVLGDYFHDSFMRIKQLVPAIEQIPEVLKTEEDYREDC